MKMSKIFAKFLLLGTLFSLYTQADAAIKSDFANVKDFGAKGDGVTDDSAAIQRAIDQVGLTGGTVFFPIGKYRIKKTLTVSGGKPIGTHELNWITLRGVGGTGAQLLGDGVDYIVRAEGRDLPGFDKNYANGLRICELTFSSFNKIKRTHGIDASGMLRTFIENCNFIHLNKGIHTFHVKRSDSIWIVRIVGNLFSQNNDWSIDIQRAFDIVISNNVIEHGIGGIKVGKPGDQADAACNTIRIENNVIEGMSQIRNPAILGASWVGASIVGNYFESNASGDIELTPQATDGWTRGVTITGNSFAPTQKQRESNDYGPILLQRATDTTISNNFSTGERLIHGKSSQLVRNVIVFGNAINNPVSVSFDGVTKEERAKYEKQQISHKLSRNRFVVSGRMNVGIDSDCGIIVGNNSISYSDHSPVESKEKSVTGDFCFSRRPQVNAHGIVIGWYCVEGGQPGKWRAVTLAQE